MRGDEDFEMSDPAPSGLTPPNDLTAEGAVLSAILIGGESGHDSPIDHVVDILKAEHFYSEANRQIYAAASDLRAQGKPVDVVQVSAWLKDKQRISQIGGMSYLVDTMNGSPVIANVRHYAKIVIDKARVRQMVQVCRQSIAEAYCDYGDADTFLARVEASVTDAAVSHVENGGEWLADAVKRIAKEHIDAMKGVQKPRGVLTGFEGLDRRLHGLKGGTTTVVAARPGMGKSAWALNAAANIARTTGGIVPFFSLEMGNDEQATRHISSEASISMNSLGGGSVGAEFITRMIEVAKEAMGLGVRLYDESSLTPQLLGGKVRRLRVDAKRQGKDVVAVFVDYMQLMKSVRRNASREQEVSDVSRGLKLLAKELKVPFVVLAQLNREGEKGTKPERPKLSNLRESGAIEQDADHVIFIHRDAYYDTSNRPTQDDIAELIIAKGRNVQKGTCRVRFDGTFTRFSKEEIESR